MENNKTFESKKWYKTLVVVISLIFVSVLFLVRILSDDFPTGYLIVGFIVIIILGFIMFFIREIKEKMLKENNEEKKEKLPPAKSREEIIKKCQKTTINKEFADLIPFVLKDSPTGIRTVGENPTTSIFEYHSKGLLTNLHYVVLMNMHFPEKYQVLINPPRLDIVKWVNYLAEKKDANPNEEKRIETDLSNGKVIEYTKKTHDKNNEKKEEKKEDNKLK